MPKLSEKYPKNLFCLEYAEETLTAFGGWEKYKNGVCIDSEELDSGSKELFDLAFDILRIEPEECGYKFNEKTQNYKWIDE